jgi:hypothetical protein
MNTFKGREIVDIELSDIDTRDYPAFADAYISDARWADTGEPLSEEELDELNQTDVVHEAVFQYLF